MVFKINYFDFLLKSYFLKFFNTLGTSSSDHLLIFLSDFWFYFIRIIILNLLFFNILVEMT
jgi:hypothetical protein